MESLEATNGFEMNFEDTIQFSRFMYHVPLTCPHRFTFLFQCHWHFHKDYNVYLDEIKQYNPFQFIDAIILEYSSSQNSENL